MMTNGRETVRYVAFVCRVTAADGFPLSTKLSRKRKRTKKDSPSGSSKRKSRSGKKGEGKASKRKRLRRSPDKWTPVLLIHFAYNNALTCFFTRRKKTRSS